MDASKGRIEELLTKYDKNWNTDENWIKGAFETCEKVAFEIKFCEYEIVARYELNEYPHETAVIVKEDGYGLHAFIYENKTDGEDSILSDGPVTAVKIIMDSETS